MSFFSILVALSIPKFDKLLNLVGASLACLQSVILPCIFYYKLRNRLMTEYVVSYTVRQQQARPLALKMKVIIWSAVVIFILIAIFGTIFSLEDIIDPIAFTEPCYMCNCNKINGTDFH